MTRANCHDRLSLQTQRLDDISAFPKSSRCCGTGQGLSFRVRMTADAPAMVGSSQSVVAERSGLNMTGIVPELRDGRASIERRRQGITTQAFPRGLGQSAVALICTARRAISSLRPQSPNPATENHCSRPQAAPDHCRSSSEECGRLYWDGPAVRVCCRRRARFHMPPSAIGSPRAPPSLRRQVAVQPGVAPTIR